MPSLAFLHSLIRKEEKLLLSELEKVGFSITRWDTRSRFMDVKSLDEEFDLAFERSVSTSQGLNTIRYFESFDVLSVNPSVVIDRCSDKIQTSLLLQRKNISQPDVYIAHSADGALQAIESLGYPVVLKPVVGSWGRLLARINDRDAAEALIEHKTTLGSYQHSSFYIQDLVEKGGRDIRSFVIGDQVVAAIYRSSDHWITNTSKGGVATNCPVTSEIEEMSIRAAHAVNTEDAPTILAIDLFESEGEILVNEVNSTMEFRNSIKTTGVNIPALMAEYLHEVTVS